MNLVDFQVKKSRGQGYNDMVNKHLLKVMSSDVKVTRNLSGEGVLIDGSSFLSLSVRT